MKWLRKLFPRKKVAGKPGLPNAHYLGIHIAAATKKSQWY